jgi:GNAT superfamily N-acetyltransferase
MPVVIRKLSPEEIAALTPATFTLAPIFDKQQIYAGLAGTFFLAEVDGAPAGAAALAYHKDFLHIDHLAVAPRLQGRGVGSALMKAILAEARQAGATAVRAEIPGWCPDWRAFYSRFGFIFLGQGASAAETMAVELYL